MSIEIIISRFQEELLELFQVIVKKNIDCNITIYNKGGDDLAEILKSKRYEQVSLIFRNEEKFKIVPLPNVGRESHTYIYHIVHNYESLQDVSIFLPGSCMNQRKVINTTKILDKAIQTKNSAFFGQYYEPNVKQKLQSFHIGEWSGTTSENVVSMPTNGCQPSNFRPFGRWLDEYFPSINFQVVCYNSIIAVSKHHILQNVVTRYESLLQQVEYHSNPEVGHFLERSWLAVFAAIPVSKIYNCGYLYDYSFC